MDVAVVSPLQSAFVKKAAEQPGYALQQRISSKQRDHEADCSNSGIQFHPMVVETLGGWAEEASKQLKRMASNTARRTGAVYSVTVRHMFERLAVILQRGNASILLRKSEIPEARVLGP